VHWVRLAFFDFLLLNLCRDKIARAIFAKEEIPKCVHQGHGDGLATASDSQVQEEWVVTVQLSNEIGMLDFLIMFFLSVCIDIFVFLFIIIMAWS
jgi:hypothetical protein